MKKIKKTIKNTMVWATESDFRLFAVVCEVCAVFFTVWACCSEVCFFWQEIVFLYVIRCPRSGSRPGNEDHSKLANRYSSPYTVRSSVYPRL